MYRFPILASLPLLSTFSGSRILALYRLPVIAIDNDPLRLRLAEHNAHQYGLAHKITFLLGDFITLAPTLFQTYSEIDNIHLAPGWGGIGYRFDPGSTTEELTEKLRLTNLEASMRPVIQEELYVQVVGEKEDVSGAIKEGAYVPPHLRQKKENGETAIGLGLADEAPKGFIKNATYRSKSSFSVVLS